jgi:hypothetical protein
MGTKSMIPTASAAKSSKPTTSAVIPTASTAPTAMPSDCRDVRHYAKRANRNAGRQNAYRSLLHRTSPLEVLKHWRGGACDNRTDLASSKI